MTTHEVANRLVELCRQGQLEQAQTELYADNVVSIEPENAPMNHVEGLENIKEKGRKFSEMVEEFHGATISDPVVGNNHFALSWALDTTMKGMGRQQMNEICLYEVKDGKVVREQFFY